MRPAREMGGDGDRRADKAECGLVGRIGEERVECLKLSI